jgi:hypothetical protein
LPRAARKPKGLDALPDDSRPSIIDVPQTRRAALAATIAASCDGPNSVGAREFSAARTRKDPAQGTDPKSRDRPPSAFLSNGHLSWRIAERGKKVAHLLLTLSTGCFVENNRRKNPNF